MPGKGMLMRPWLEMQINSNQIPGLQWIDKEEQIFQIPWMHASRHGWEAEKHACLFQKWAMHTGRYKVDEKKTDAKTWKANFRCALNSLPDIEEVKGQSINKGSSAVRVYRMLPAAIKAERKERRSKPSRHSKNKAIKTDCEDNSLECRLGTTTSFSVVDHNVYTKHSYLEQDMEVHSTDIPLGIVTYEVSSLSELANGIEVSPADSTNDMYPFQVSPASSCTSEEEEDDTLTDSILEMMEPTTWHQAHLDGKGYLSTETGTPFTDFSLESEKLAGEIELRFTTDLTAERGIDFWLESEYLSHLSTVC